MVGMCRRLAAVFDVMGLDDKRISQMLGYSGQATLSSVRKGTTFLDTERLSVFGRLLVRDCAKPNLHWILTGDGAPLLQKSQRADVAKALNAVVLDAVQARDRTHTTSVR